ncbi:MAG: MaoC/PaaZ C-terminal domain-containing protein [Pirellulaceae bacterium]
MTEPLHFEDLAVGDRWISLGRTVTETDIVNFAGMTGDYDPLHVDHEFARQTPFGKPIAHGLLGLSLVAGLASQCPSVRTIAFLKIESWEFLKPIYIGDTVHAETEVLTKNANGRRTGFVTWRRCLVNQVGDVVQSGIFQTLVSVAQIHRKQSEIPTAAAVVPSQHAPVNVNVSVKRAVG